MRLLHSTTLELRDFLNHEDIPYAILSHTWAEEEVLFQEVDGFNATTMPDVIKQKLGFKKIEACCAQAQEDGFDYIWIDTCCIDKRSSAELSEAINSMYRWYQNCAVCYAYLADVSNDATLGVQADMFKKSRWFTRGWTLQELIGPLHLEFYGDQWHTKSQGASLGTKASLRSEIVHITNIPEDAFMNLHYSRGIYSIAQKMSWAANRSTSRVEDRAYCLLGLFNVNMPLLYGERERAFVRLQEEIIKVSSDESLFAWATAEKEFSSKHNGLLALSADSFANSGRIVKKIFNQRQMPSSVTNKGLRLETSLVDASTLSITHSNHPKVPEHKIGKIYAVVLNCMDVSSGHRVAILLAPSARSIEDTEFVRLDPQNLELINPLKYSITEKNRTDIYARISYGYGVEASYIDTSWRHSLFESHHKTLVLKTIPSGFRVVSRTPEELWTNSQDSTLWMAKLAIYAYGAQKLYMLAFGDGNDGFTVAFTFYAEQYRVQVLPGDHSNLVKSNEFAGKVRLQFKESSGRASGVLSSGRIVSASLRPERRDGEPCYVLRIAVSATS